MHSCYQRQITR